MEITNYYYGLNDILFKQSYPPYHLARWNDVLVHLGGLSTPISELLPELNNSDDTKALLDPLILRWTQDEHIHLIRSDEEIDWTYAEPRLIHLKPIFVKLNTILPTYKELYKRYNTFITKIDNGGIETETSSESVSRHNDTPNASGDYSTDKYTSGIDSVKSTSKQSTNELENYDLIKSRLENLPQQIIDEMKVFEIWI